jgi:hypothetical protein
MKKNAHITLKFILGCFYLFASISSAQTVELYCKGKTSGDFQSENQEFTLNVTFSPADFYEIPLKYVPGCMKLGTAPDSSCTATKNTLNCSCSNSLAITSLVLSRVTGRLNIESIYIKGSQSQKGDYSCEKVTQRKF